MAPLEGNWSGILDIGHARARLVLRFVGDGGEPKAWLDIPTQNIRDLPVDILSLSRVQLKFAVPLAGATFDGSAIAADKIAGAWRQAGGAFPLTLSHGLPAAREFGARPQSPALPSPHVENDVEIAGPAGILSGTLTTPRSAGCHPCLVMFPWAGRTNRDQSVGGHRPFAVWADVLAKRGIATLRCDKRGVGGSAGRFEAATTDDFVDDLRATLAFARRHPLIEPAHVGLMGHSEGALVCATVAADDGAVPYCVMLAPPSLNGRESLLRQSERISRKAGVPDAIVAQGLELDRRIFSAIVDRPHAEAEALAREILKGAVQDGVIEEVEIEHRLAQANSPWQRRFLALRPTDVYRRVETPVLCISGGHDLQTAAADHGPSLRDAFADHTSASLLQIPRLNHLLQPAISGLPSEYADIELSISPVVIEKVLNWLDRAPINGRLNHTSAY